MTEAEQLIRAALATGHTAGGLVFGATPENISALLADRDEREAALRAEVDALRADAGRFRWLLDKELPDWMDLYHQHPDRVRERIDAQIEQERSEQAKEGTK